MQSLMPMELPEWSLYIAGYSTAANCGGGDLGSSHPHETLTLRVVDGRADDEAPFTSPYYAQKDAHCSTIRA